ncbi:hypothetical protein PNEG_03070 [Pneumocystis murina B123]|uniref:FAR1 domain-containing protein n=1 Tax=Pneumocystis murina (strain B123) TaxID=1069680 RepID=M7PDP6_PNEMU|nr:hypothetical protein PNEG_03070 [Pneumocystis murina B123]EMR08594.1 hypothetical protein PNEG_03070 [Pneumocystis murina B123]
MESTDSTSSTVVDNNIANIHYTIHPVDSQNLIPQPQVGVHYASPEDIRAMLDAYAKFKGFAVSVRASNRITYRWQCVHGGKYRNTRNLPNEITVDPVIVSDPTIPHRQRKQTTKRTNCPWLVRAGLSQSELWKITKVVDEHNHRLYPEDPTIYHQNRPMTKQRVQRKKPRKPSARILEQQMTNTALSSTPLNNMESTLKIISLVPQDFEQGIMDPELDIDLDESIMRTIGTQTEEV